MKKTIRVIYDGGLDEKLDKLISENNGGYWSKMVCPRL